MVRASGRVLAVLASGVLLAGATTALGGGTTAAACTITQGYSLGGTTPATIEFVNATGGTLSVYWLDYNGNRQLWFRLAAGQSVRQNTFIGHAWLVTDAAGTCVGYVVSIEPSQRLVIGAAATTSTQATTTTTPTPPPKPKPKPVSIATVTVRSRPRVPAAGSTFRITASIRLSTGRTVAPASTKCRAKLGPTLLRGTRKGCSFTIPKSAAGRRLVVAVTVTYAGKAKTRTVAFAVPAAKPKPKPKPPPAGGAGSISTPVGKLLVDGVQFTDRFPPGCVLGTAFCDQADPGFRVLIVWLKRADGADPAAISEKFSDLSQGAYVVASNGKRTNVFSGGLLAGSLFVAFTPAASSHGFALHWPGNPAVPLGT
jgi:hypothetical protein